jgi:transposase
MSQSPNEVPARKDQPVHPNGRHVIGIDISLKNHSAAGLTAAGQPFGRSISFSNDRAGVDRLETLLLKPMGGPGQILIGMEATGHYWMPIFFELRARRYDCIVINPIQTRGQFRTRIRKTTTDKLDARSIADLVHRGKALAARIPSEDTLRLRLQVRQRWRLVHLASDLSRFAHSLIDRLFPEFHDHFHTPLNATGRALLRQIGLAPQALVDHAIEVHSLARRASRARLSTSDIDTLIQRARASIGIRQAEDVLVSQLRSTLELIEGLERQIDVLDTDLEERAKKLNSPLGSLGLSPALIATIHAESDPITDFKHPWQYAAYAGLDPSLRQSGQIRNPQTPISKRGSPYLRHALYLAAAAHYRHCTPLQRLYQKKRKEKHHHTDALVIVAHKLARIVWSLLTHKRQFRITPPKPKLKTP